MTKAILQLEPLTCPSCIQKIQGVLGKVDGVQTSKVLFNSSRAKVEYDESKTSPEQLKETVEKLGYDVVSVKTS